MPQPNPIQALLHSRKFLLAVAALVITLLGHYGGVPSDVLTMIDGVLVALIASIAWEDGATKSTTQTTINAAAGDVTSTNAAPLPPAAPGPGQGQG